MAGFTKKFVKRELIITMKSHKTNFPTAVFTLLRCVYRCLWPACACVCVHIYQAYRLRLLGTACERTPVAQPQPLASNNCLRLNFLRLHSAANLFFLCIRVILPDASLHVKPIV